MTKKVTVRLYEKFPQEYAEGGLVQASELARQHGRFGDDILIHVNPEEFSQMQQMWGEPTHNPHTGLPEYGFLSKLWNKIKKVVKAVAPIALNFIPGVGTAVSAGLSALGVGAKVLPLATKIATGAIGGAIGGGSKGAIAGGLTGGILGGAGGQLASKVGLDGALGKIAGNAVLSGAANSALGGKFGTGALIGGGLTAALPYLNNAIADTSLGKTLGLTGGMETLSSPELAPVEPSAARYYPGPEDTYTTYANGAPGSMGGQTAAPGGLEEILVSASRNQPTVTSVPAVTSADAAASAVPWISPNAVGDAAAATGAAPATPATPATDPNSSIVKGSFLDKAFGLLNNQAGLTALTGVVSALNPPETAQAPAQPDWATAPLPQYDFTRTRRPMTEEDFYTYGERPEASFYDYNGPPVRAADGGLIMGGAGGRADDIDAKLSGGEYVMDAETVALLGDGSVAAGARKLDELRAKLRMEKGAAMANGEISAPAGKAQDYLSGDFAADVANANAPEGDFSGDMGYDPKGENLDPSAADMARENDTSLSMTERYPELSKAQRAKSGKLGRGYPGYENPGPVPGLEGLTRIRAFNAAGGSPRSWDPRSEFEDAVRASDYAVEQLRMHKGPESRKKPALERTSDFLLSKKVLNKKSRKKLGKVISDLNMGAE